MNEKPSAYTTGPDAKLSENGIQNPANRETNEQAFDTSRNAAESALRSPTELSIINSEHMQPNPRNSGLQSRTLSDNSVQKNSTASEEQLIAACVNGERKAQRLFYERFHRKMYVVALRYSKTTFEAEDMLQESFVKIFRNLTDFRRECPLEFWVKRTVINTALKYNRRIIDKMPTEDIQTMIDEPSESVTLSDYGFKDLLGFIQQLSPGYRTIFNLYAIEGYKHREIAETLDISEGTSKSQYARAKVLLQKMILNERQPAYEDIARDGTYS